MEAILNVDKDELLEIAKEIDETLATLTIHGDGAEWRVDQLRGMLKEEGYEVEKSWRK